MSELSFRRSLITALLHLLRTHSEMMHDERAPVAIAEYEIQLAAVDAEIQRRAQPEPVVVKLAPARMIGK